VVFVAVSDFASGALAAIAGGLVGGFVSWVGLLLIERRRENLQLIGAMDMLRAEIDENADRLDKEGDAGRLTLGVWEQCKPIFAGVGRRAIDTGLWDDLHGTYRAIYERRGSASANANDPEQPQPQKALSTRDLNAISARLREASRRFEGEFKSWWYWIKQIPNRRP
jgi:hypothetical protein